MTNVDDVLIGVEFEMQVGGAWGPERVREEFPEWFVPVVGPTLVWVEPVTQPGFMIPASEGGCTVCSDPNCPDNLPRPERWVGEVTLPGFYREELPNGEEFTYQDRLPKLKDGGWAVVHEYPMGSEFIFNGPQKFSTYDQRFGELFEFIDAIRDHGTRVSTGAGMSMHVHVNVDERKAEQYDGGALTPEGLVGAYFANNRRIQGQFFDLQYHEGRNETGWCNRVRSAYVVPQFQTKGDDIAKTDLGTFELRAWDSTLDRRTIERRRDVLGGLLEQAIAIAEG